MKTILVTAYAVNPFKGSEDGTGWNIVKEISKEFKVILITRKNNIEHLNKYLESAPPELKSRIEYHGFDLSDRVLKLKKMAGSKGHVGYFYLWQRSIIGFLKKQSFDFSASISLNFHSDSHPHFLWKLDKPCLWGPIGHHPRIPKSFVLKTYGMKAYITDRLFYRVKWLMRNVNPSFKKAVKQSERIFVINSSIRKVIGASESKTIQLPAVAANYILNKTKQQSNSFTVLCAGRFHFMKGFDVTLRSFFAFLDQLPIEDQKHARLILVGKGPEKKVLQKIAEESNYAANVEWLEWVDHYKMDELYRASDVFLFPSHEGAGMVVPEAMSHGLPVLTFDNVGPGELSGIKELKVAYGNYDNSIAHFAQKLLSLFTDRDELSKLADNAREKQRLHLTWESKGEIIRKELNQVIKNN